MLNLSSFINVGLLTLQVRPLTYESLQGVQIWLTQPCLHTLQTEGQRYQPVSFSNTYNTSLPIINVGWKVR